MPFFHINLSVILRDCACVSIDAASPFNVRGVFLSRRPRRCLMQMPAGVEGMCAFNDLRFSTLECNYILK